MPWKNDRVLASDRSAGCRSALDFTVDARTLLAVLFPGSTVLVDGTVSSARLLALALLHFAYSALCSG